MFLELPPQDTREEAKVINIIIAGPVLPMIWVFLVTDQTIGVPNRREEEPGTEVGTQKNTTTVAARPVKSRI